MLKLLAFGHLFKKLLQSSETIKVGDTVLILHPEYVVGRIGLVCGKEEFTDKEAIARWLIQVDSENIIVLLTADEFGGN